MCTSFPGGRGSGGTVGRPVLGKSGLIPRLHVRVTLCKILLHLQLPYLNSVISALPLRRPASRSALDFGRLEQQSTLICDRVGQHAMWTSSFFKHNLILGVSHSPTCL